MTAEPSPPRRLTRRRKILLGIALPVIAFAGYELWWRATFKPRPVIDYAARFEQLSAAHQPPGENGWSLFVDAAEQYEAVTIEIRELALDERNLDFSAVVQGPLDRTTIEQELHALQLLQERGVVDKLREAAGHRRTVREFAAEPPVFRNLVLPELSLLRKLVESRVASMRLAADEGDQAERVAAFEQAMAIGRATSSQPVLIARLIGISAVIRALEESQYELLEYGVDETTGRALLDALARQGRWPPFSIALDGERYGSLDMIQYCFTDDGHGDGRLDIALFEEQMAGAAPATGTPLQKLASHLLAGRADNERLANAFFDQMITEAKLDPATRMEQGSQVPVMESQFTMRYPLLRAVLPAIWKAVTHDDRFQLELAATKLLLAIETYRAVNGRLPATLEELAPDVLEQIPRDPTHGGLFVYRLTQNDPHQLGYVLYSSGIDRVDDSAVSLEATGQLSGDDVAFLESRPGGQPPGGE